MNIDVTVQERGRAAELEFRSFRDWMAGAGRELREAGITVQDRGEPPRPGDMGGGTFEVVRFVCDTVAQYGALAVAIAAWRDAHAVRSPVTFERNGVRVTLPAASLSDEAVVRAALEGLGEGERSGGPPEQDAGPVSSAEVPRGPEQDAAPASLPEAPRGPEQDAAPAPSTEAPHVREHDAAPVPSSDPPHVPDPAPSPETPHLPDPAPRDGAA